MLKLSPEQIRTADIATLPQTRTPPPTNSKRGDIRELFRAFGISTFLRGGDIRRGLAHIRSDEILFYIKPTEATLARKDGSGSFKEYSIVFFTNQRVLITANSGRLIDEFALHDIHSVTSQKASYVTGYVTVHFSFCTDKKLVEFETTKSENITIELLAEAVLTRLITEFGPAIFLRTIAEEQTQAPEPISSISNTARVVECPSCTARAIIIPGMLAKCEYCDRLLDVD
jgi:hypothetical protein